MDSYKSKFTEASYGDIVRNLDNCISSSYDLIEHLERRNNLSGGEGLNLRSKITELRDNLSHILKRLL